MAVFTRGFGGRRQREAEDLPPGQYLADGFPVLTAGPTQYVDTDDWSFTITTETDERHTWSWHELLALPVEDVTVDIHCVTRWSKLQTRWRGVPVDAFFEDVESTADYVMAHSYGGYTTNLPLEDLLDGKAWVAFEYDDDPLHRRARRTGAAAGAAPLLLEVGQVAVRVHHDDQRRARLLGGLRLPQLRGPVARGAVRR